MVIHFHAARLLRKPLLLVGHPRLQDRRPLPLCTAIGLGGSQRRPCVPQPDRQAGVLLAVAVGSAVQPILRLLKLALQAGGQAGEDDDNRLVTQSFHSFCASREQGGQSKRMPPGLCRLAGWQAEQGLGGMP